MRHLRHALLLLPPTLLIACGPSTPEQEAAARPVAVESLSLQAISRAASYPADIQPWAKVHLYTTVADRVLSIPVEDGDEVRKGQQVMLIRRAGLDKGIEQVAAQIEALDIQIRTQTQDLERSAELLEGGVITEQMYDQAEAALEANEAQRRALQASLEQISLNAGEASVVAPIAGIVADIALDVGDRTSPQAPLAAVLVVDPLRVDLSLPEPDARQVQGGDPVDVSVSAWPERVFKGEVNRVRPYLEEGSRTVTVEVRLPNDTDEDAGLRLLKPGMFGKATLTLDRREDVVVAPEKALVLDPTLLARSEPGQALRKAFVVDEEGVVEERTVELGIRSGTSYEVKSGLAPGERLVVKGQHWLRDGDTVNVTEEGP